MTKTERENEESPQPPDVSPEEQAATLREQGVVPSASSASGLAAMGSPEGEDTAREEAEGMDGWTPPRINEEGGENSPAQQAPALFTSNGSLPLAHIASPSGPVPSTVIGDEKTRIKAVEAQQQAAQLGPRGGGRGLRRLTLAQIQGMNRAEVRAVAADRGYDVPERAGRARMNQLFLQAQEKDELVTQDAAEPQARLLTQPAVPGVLGGGTTVAAPGGAKEAEERVQSVMQQRQSVTSDVSEPVQQDRSASLAASQADEPPAPLPAGARGTSRAASPTQGAPKSGPSTPGAQGSPPAPDKKSS